MNEKLSPEQIKNWRNALIPTLGPYALIMPDVDVHKMRDVYQKKLNEIPEAKPGELEKAKEAVKEMTKPGFRLGGLSNKII